MQRSQTAGRTRRSLTSLAAGLALAAAVVGLPATPAAAVTCKVNTATNPTQSQIQAILDAGPTTITFSGTCPGGLFINRSGLLIRGASAAATVTGDTNFDANPESRVFQVAPGVTVTFQNLRIVYGEANSGGGAGVEVLDGASATFTKVAFDGNVAQYAAAISFETLSVGVITNSTFTNNFAYSYSGGAIAACDAALSVTGSTFTGNRANWSGGALFIDSDCDGGVASVLSITRSTFAGNQAMAYDGGAIYLDTANATIASSVFSRNGATSDAGAIAANDTGDVDPALAISNSSFTANRAEGNSAGALGVTGYEVLRLTGDKFTSNFANEYGGGVASYGTDVQIAGSTFASNTARGYHGGGAYIEWYDAAGTPDGVTVTSSSFTGNSAGLTGGGLFTGWTGDVTISGSTFSKNVALNLNCIWFCGTNREGGGGIMLRATDAEITDSVVAENRAVSDGGGIMFFDRDNEGQGCDQLTITRSIIRKNVSGRDGGGLWANGQCERAMFDDNPMYPNGGPLSAVGLQATTVTQNTAAGSGGGIALTGAFCCWDPNEGVYWSDDATTISQNSAAYDGGGIWAYDWDVTARGSVVGNRAGRDGGGIFFDMITDWRHILTLTDVKVERNAAATYGGGVFFQGDTYAGWLDITDEDGPVSISYNRLTSTALWASGGGVFANLPKYFGLQTDNYGYDGQHTILIKSNSAGFAGGIYLYGCQLGCFADDGVRITANVFGGMAGCGYIALNADFDNNNPQDCV